MEGVEGLYKKFGVLADAKDKAGEYEAEYLSILSTISNGSDAEKRLCASFIPRFFKSFPNHQETAFNAQLNLCEEEEAVIRREAIKGLPDLCKADSKLVARMANVLAQLLPTEGHLDQTIVKHCLVQLLKQDTKCAIAGIVNQIITGDDIVREKSLKFLLEKLNAKQLCVPQLQTDEKLKTFFFDKLEEVCKSATYEEFMDIVHLASGFNSRRTSQLISNQISLDKPFDPSNVPEIEKFARLVSVLLKHHTKCTSNILKFYSSVIPVFSQIQDPQHQLLLLQSLAETLHVAISEEDAALCLDGLYSLLMSYLPDTVPDNTDIDQPPPLNFSMLECLLFSLHKTAKQVPEFLKEEDRIKELQEKLQYVLRCCTCYAKRLKSSAIGDDTPEQVKLKTKAYKTCNNTKELAKGLLSTTIIYKTDINFSWKVNLSNVTKRPLAAAVAAKKTRSISPTPIPKRRRSGAGTQQVYAPPTGRYSSNIGMRNGHDTSRERRDRGKDRRDRY